MKKISVFLAVLALFFVDAAFARAVITTLNGTAQVSRGTTPARVLRLGDEVNQGDTIATGPNSSLVMKFDDGQVTALTSNSRMTITAYEYNAQAGSGNILLSLITGGMRAVTGLIGRNTPERVSYRAATATIGIRGTDVTIVTEAGNVVVTVTDGEITFNFNGQVITLTAGQGVNARTNAPFQAQAIQAVLDQVSPDVLNAIGGLQALTGAMAQAAAGQGGLYTGTGSTPGGAAGGSGGGGGGGSTPSPN